MELLNVKQGSDEWLQARAKHFTASEAPAMMGVSKYTSRDQLLAEKASGVTAEVSDAQQRLYDRGHESEDQARPLVEAIIGEELYPVTGTEGKFLASFDGLTMDHSIGYEHKLWSESLAEQVRSGELEPHYYWQLEQQLLVSGADKIIFATSNGTEEAFEYLEYTAVPGRREALIAGWDQFEKDLENFEPVTHDEPAKAKPMASLPAVSVELVGEVRNTNLPAVKERTEAFLANINLEPDTDEDFAEAEQVVKVCKEAEDRLKLVKDQALSQTASIEDFFTTLDEIGNNLRTTRLHLDKVVKERKQQLKTEIVMNGKRALSLHLQELNNSLEGYQGPFTQVRISQIDADFTESAKGKKTLKSIREAVNDVVAQTKIKYDTAGRQVLAALKFLNENAAEHDMLFRDAAELVHKDLDHMKLIVKQRIEEFERREQERKDREAEQAERAKAAAEAQQAAEPEPPADYAHPARDDLKDEKPQQDFSPAPLSKAPDLRQQMINAFVSGGLEHEAASQAAHLILAGDIPGIELSRRAA